MKYIKKLFGCGPAKCIQCGAHKKACELVNGLCSNCRPK